MGDVVNGRDTGDAPDGAGFPSPFIDRDTVIQGSTGSALDANDVFTFVAPASGSARFTLSQLGTDLDLYLLDVNGQTLASSDALGTASESFSLALQRGETYYLAVVGFGVESTYRLAIDFAEPVELRGTTAADTLSGGSADEKLLGLAGDDLLRGGGGFDTVVLQGNAAGYAFGESGGQLRIRDVASADGNEGSDRAEAVESIRFADLSYGLAFDAGSAIPWQLSASATDDVLQLGGLGGSLSVDGRGGRDVAVFSGKASEYAFGLGDAAVTVRDLVRGNGDDGTRELQAIETLRFSDRDLVITGGEFRVNTTTAGTQVVPAIGALAGGGYVVFWSSDEGNGALSYFQRFSAAGVALGEETRVDPDFEGYVVSGAITGLADGGFVATWIAEPLEGTGELRFARFDAEGRQVGDPRGVDAPTAGTEWFSAVTRLADGGFAIAWSTSGDADERFSVRVRTFDADGTPRGAGLTVSTATTGHDFAPAVAALANGGFVVSWLSVDDSVTPRILARRIDADGRALGGVITVDQSSGAVADLVADIDTADPAWFLTLAELVAPDVAAFEGGGFVVGAASRSDPDTPAAGLLHRFDAAGTRIGTAIPVDTVGMSGLDVETLAGDVIVVTWMGVQDPAAAVPDLDIFLRRFRGDGTPLGETRLVNSSTDANQLIVELQSLEGGGYVVVWSSEGQDLDDLGLFAQQYQQNGEVVRVEVRGTDGADVLFYIGDDPMRAEGLAGDDVYLVQRAQDQTIEKAGEGTDTVKAELSWTLSANLENLVLSGAGNLNGGGNGLRNELTGNDGNNRLNGGAGADTLRGGAGNDTYFVDSRDDVVDEVSTTPTATAAGDAETPAGTGSNVDTVVAQVSYSLSANVENLQLSGSAALNGNGNGLANIIAGNDGANRLSGNGGNDTMDGGKGNDTLLGGDGADRLSGAAGNDSLAGGKGKDTLSGGAGADHFLFDIAPGADAGADLISDFTAGSDRIVLDDDAFKAFSAATGSTVATGQLVNRAADALAQDANDVLIYKQSTGELYYDADGNGAAASPVLVASFSVKPATLSAGDFLIVG